MWHLRYGDVLFFSVALQAESGVGRLVFEVSKLHTITHTHIHTHTRARALPVWASDQLVARSVSSIFFGHFPVSYYDILSGTSRWNISKFCWRVKLNCLDILSGFSPRMFAIVCLPCHSILSRYFAVRLTAAFSILNHEYNLMSSFPVLIFVRVLSINYLLVFLSLAPKFFFFNNITIIQNLRTLD
jgi:hypothetical protein